MLDEPLRTRIRRKFDVCYLMVKEGIAFKKYASLCELEAHHEVDLGHAYRTASTARLFTYYTAQVQPQQYLQSLSEIKFYSFLVDLLSQKMGVRSCPTISGSGLTCCHVTFEKFYLSLVAKVLTIAI